MLEPESPLPQSSHNGVGPLLQKKKLPTWRVGVNLNKKMLRMLAEARKKSQ